MASGKIFHEIKTKNVQESLVRGIGKVAELVSLTLGPGGQNVLIDGFDMPHVTKDGVTVARSIIGKSEEDDIAIRLLKQVGEQQFENIGDGTTTATLILSRLISGYYGVTQGTVNHHLIREVNGLIDQCIGSIDRQTMPCDDEAIQAVIRVSCNWDESIHSLVSKAIESVGPWGAVDIVHSSDFDDRVETHKGMSINQGWFSHYYMNNQRKMNCELEDAFVLIYDHFLHDVEMLVSFLTAFVNEHGSKPIVIIANAISPAVNATFFENVKSGVVSGCLIEWEGVSGASDEKEDLAVVSGGKLVSPQKGDDRLNKSHVSCLGRVERFVSNYTSSKFTAKPEEKEAINERALILQEALEETTNETIREMLQKRIGYLTGGVARIFVSGGTSSEIKERADRVDDAYKAAQKAKIGGVVPGGGMAHLQCIPDLYSQTHESMDIVVNALQSPFRKIHSNNGTNADVVDALINDVEYGEVEKSKVCKINPNSGDVDFWLEAKECGLLNPAKTEISALKLAKSLFNTVASTGGSLIIKTKSE